jgi:membrane protease YdiL (CAAX protease family)
VQNAGGTWIALVVSSPLFGVAHALNPGATFSSTIGIALQAGVMLGLAYSLTRRLWLPIGIHIGWNFA